MKYSLTELYNLQNDVDKIDVSTYHGSLDPERLDIESKYYDLEINWEETKTNIAKQFNKEDYSFLNKYGITVNGFSFYMPKAYNYANDSIDIDIDIDIDKLKESGILESKELKYYFDEIRQPSYDGYLSLEASSLKDFDIEADNLYCILFAIFIKEDAFDIIKTDVENIIDDMYGIFSCSYVPIKKELENKIKELLKEGKTKEIILENYETLFNDDYIKKEDIEEVFNEIEEKENTDKLINKFCFNK